MTIKILLYCVALPFSVWAIDCLNIDKILKKNRYYQARILYLFLSMSMSYLVVNFLYDVFLNSKII